MKFKMPKFSLPFLCQHVWKIIEEQSFTRDGFAYSKQYSMQCEKCGNIKIKKWKYL